MDNYACVKSCYNGVVIVIRVVGHVLAIAVVVLDASVAVAFALTGFLVVLKYCEVVLLQIIVIFVLGLLVCLLRVFVLVLFVLI